MLELASEYLPRDRRQALLKGEGLPDRTEGTALFADISGFTPLTEALVKELGPRRGADELTRQLNRVYDALIAEVHRYRGSVLTFSGDAITCWFDQDEGLRATASSLAMQQAMTQFAQIEIPSGLHVSMAMKAAVTSGPVRRFLIGAPRIQQFDVLAGTTLDHMAEAESQAQKGEVVLGPETIDPLAGLVEISRWRADFKTGKRFAVVTGLLTPVEATPWPLLSPEALTMDQIRPWLLPSVYKHLQTGPSRFLAELRPAVALFLKFGGLDYDADDDAGEKLDIYIQWVQNILARYESYLFQLTIGDKGCYLYAAFGAPVAHDDDAARAVAAALELRTPPAEMNFISGAQIGISQGRMRAGAYGGSMRRTYGVLGDEVNLAARLMGKAAAGQVLVSQPIADATARSYIVEPLGPVEVKGKTDPLPVFKVVNRAMPSPQNPATLFTHPLVGREDELAQMEALLTATLEGQGQILRLEGDAGLGKSHLAAEFAERALRRGFTLMVGACQSTGQDIAYYPWRQAARAFFNLAEQPLRSEELPAWSARQIAQIEELVDQVNPDWALRLPLLGDLLGLPIPDNPTTAAFDPQLRQEALFALAVKIVQNRAGTEPLFLLLEDVHWMDEASRGLTLALGRVVANIPVMLVLVHRPPVETNRPILPELAPLPNHHHIDLGELSAEGVAALATYRLQGIPSPLTVSLIQTQAHGNPFFTEELIDALRETESLFRKSDGHWLLSKHIFNALLEANCLQKTNGEWELAKKAALSAVNLGIPDSIHGVVLSRLDRLPEKHKLTLKVASVIGRIFEFELLHRAYPLDLGREKLLQQIEILEHHDFARLELPPPRLSHMFKHNITQEVTYNTLLDDQQRELHRTVAETLEQLNADAVEQLAYHYSRSGVRHKTLFYLDKAARKAQSEYANETALNYYNQALALEERWQWRIGQVEVLHILGRREEELGALNALEANPEAAPFDVDYLWGQYHEAIGNYVEAKKAVERAMVLCHDQGDIPGQVRCQAQLGLIARRLGDYDQAKVWYKMALITCEQEEINADLEARALAPVLNGLGIVYRQQSQFEEATACYEQARMLSRKIDNRQLEAEALNSLGVTAYYQRTFTAAITYYREALEIRRTIGDRPGEGTSLYNLASATLDSGDYGQAQRYFSEALTIQQATGNRWEEGNVWNVMGMLYQELGDLAMAQSCLQRALTISQEIGDEVGQAYILGNLGLVMRDQEDLKAAENLLNNGLTIARTQDDQYVVSQLVSELGLVSLLAGNVERALERAKEALAARQELDLRLWTTADLTTLAAAHLSLDDRTQALQYARQAITILDECGGEGPVNPQQDYFICYQVFAACGEKEAAQSALQAAYELVMARAEKITDPTLRQSFLERVQINRDIVQAMEGAGE